ncbi:hypothetical protein [Corynebacterium sp. BF-R-2]|uniref:hypothetical protein n=1 Tax=Corynebacterium sp. BF-R-2 TaxID=2943494 RepID=UPI00211E4D3B|nr:hypothetical protein [Corynebacterium sp. BF-R-2]MCQ9677108.1 hypothetical protein [Corynebacterium sp. BF-R-2]
MTSTKTRRPFAALAAVAAAGLLAAGCSSSADVASPTLSTAAEPAFENTYPAFEPLNDDSQVRVPNTPKPTMPGAAPAVEGPSSIPVDNDGQAAQHIPQQAGVQATNPAQEPNSRQTIEAARVGSINHVFEQLPKDKPNGAKVNVHGTPATMCLMGDGYNITYVMAGENTSCDFARSTAGRLMGSTPSPKEDLRRYMPAQILVNSPVTHQDYNLACHIDDHEVVRCTGGNGAEVLIV